MDILRPYLIISQLIEQPTWGGNYIISLKNWTHKVVNPAIKIGQSYELSGTSQLATTITDTKDPQFSPNLVGTQEVLALSDLVSQSPEQILGKNVTAKYDKMPLLIKLTQAYGNSFQLHIKPGQVHQRWQPKPESWYFLEDGYVSCGINSQADMHVFKQTCQDIEAYMHTLSSAVTNGSKTIESARSEAASFIQSKDPWQFVQLHHIQKNELIDLSGGGIHHSWEEKRNEFPQGNIVYEVQLDVADDVCTIRSFDQGKIKDDGTLRELHIEDYFHFLDSNQQSNDINTLKRKKVGHTFLQTPYYVMDCIDAFQNYNDETRGSFVHLYVRDGQAAINAADTTLHLLKGHSCFIPAGVDKYNIKTTAVETAILKTYVPI